MKLLQVRNSYGSKPDGRDNDRDGLQKRNVQHAH